MAFKLLIGFSLFLLSLLNVDTFTATAQEATGNNEIEIVRNVFEAMNNHDLEGLDSYFAEDIEVVSIQELAPRVNGKDAAFEMLRQMLEFATGSEFTFSSGPFSMGDIVTVEYFHHYEIDGNSRQDHNVSVFVFDNQKIKKWLGYIHQN